jgi:hypothetical protein
MKCGFVFLNFLFLLSCSTLQIFSSPFDHTNFGDQVESLFRRQNQASHQVMMLLLDDSENIDLEKIEQAEFSMLEACKPLNEFAILERDNQKISLSNKQKILRSIPVCEQKTETLEKLLQQLLKRISLIFSFC